MKKYCFALDLKDDPQLMQEYVEIHQNVWPEIKKSIRDSGILEMEIYKVSNRLFMVMEVKDGFSFESKSENDASNAKVQDWEQLMWKYQQALPGAREGEKWMLMENIFKLNS